jgi:hypothetical protein
MKKGNSADVPVEAAWTSVTYMRQEIKSADFGTTTLAQLGWVIYIYSHVYGAAWVGDIYI